MADWPTVDAELIRYDKIATAPTRQLAAMKRIRVPLSEAGDVLRLLAKEKITGARLFPTFAGAARALDDEHCWRSIDDVKRRLGRG